MPGIFAPILDLCGQYLYNLIPGTYTVTLNRVTDGVLGKQRLGFAAYN